MEGPSWREPREQDGGAGGACRPSLGSPWWFHSACWVPEGHWTPSPRPCGAPAPPTLLSCPWAVLLVAMWPGGSFLPQAAAVPRPWLPGHSPWQPLCQPRRREAWGTVGLLGCGGVLAGGGAVAGQWGLGWAPRPSVVAGLWGWLRARGLPGQEPCSGAGPRAVAASWVGLEPCVCLEKKLGWAGVPSAGVSPWAEGATVLAVGQARGCSQTDRQTAPCPAPILETQAHTSFWGLFPPSSLHKGP